MLMQQIYRISLNSGKVTEIANTGGFILGLALDASNKGYQVVVFDNLSRRGTDLNLQYLSANANIVFVEGDVCSSEEVDRLVCENCDAEAFFHFAGQVAVTVSIQDPRADFLTNAMGSIVFFEKSYGFRSHFRSHNDIYKNVPGCDSKKMDRILLESPENWYATYP